MGQSQPRVLTGAVRPVLKSLHAQVEDAVAIRQPAADGRIVRNPAVLGGEPIVRGTRISVRSVVLAAREYGGSEGVLEAYPQLAPADVHEALAFYEAYSDEIDQYIRLNLAEG